MRAQSPFEDLPPRRCSCCRTRAGQRAARAETDGAERLLYHPDEYRPFPKGGSLSRLAFACGLARIVILSRGIVGRRLRRWEANAAQAASTQTSTGGGAVPDHEEDQPRREQASSHSISPSRNQGSKEMNGGHVAANMNKGSGHVDETHKQRDLDCSLRFR